MQRKKDKRILVALDLTHESGRAHLNGFYRYADKQPEWEVRIVPSTEASYAPMVKEIVAAGIEGAVIKGECVPALAETIFAARVPVVSIDKPGRAGPRRANAYVVNDNARIGLAAAQYFKRLGRFAAYGFVPDPNDCEWSQMRGRAFTEAVAHLLGADACRRYTPPPDDGTGAPTFRSGLSRWLAALPKPAAVFAAFDQCAATVLEECRDNRLKVPSEIAVLGVDDDALVCEHARPKLTSIRPDHARQGYEAARELNRLMSRPGGGAMRRGGPLALTHIGITERDSTTFVPQGLRIVREITAYLDEHALTPIRVADIVAHAGVSERLANLRYSELTGHSIQEELINRRLAEAKRLLKETALPLARISSRCGFKSQIVLAHLFRKHVGQSMSDWRRARRGEG